MKLQEKDPIYLLQFVYIIGKKIPYNSCSKLTIRSCKCYSKETNKAQSRMADSTIRCQSIVHTNLVCQHMLQWICTAVCHLVDNDIGANSQMSSKPVLKYRSVAHTL